MPLHLEVEQREAEERRRVNEAARAAEIKREADEEARTTEEQRGAAEEAHWAELQRGVKLAGRDAQPAMAPAPRTVRPKGFLRHWVVATVAIGVLGEVGFLALPRGPTSNLHSPPAIEAPSIAWPAVALAFDDGHRDCERICPRMVLIPKGQFVMGIPASESKREGTEAADKDASQHPVTIRRAFYLSETPVTRGEYSHCVNAGVCKEAAKPSFAQTDNDPVVNVSYDDAKDYIGWLRTASGGKDYRLPTESEWEYAARAKTTSAWYWGDDFDDAHPHTVPRSRHATMPVKSFPPNNFNVYDMLGNVWQWVEDCYIDNYDGGLPADEQARTTTVCGRRVLRGGSWLIDLRGSRAGRRDGLDSGGRVNGVGFRLARTY
jgi:formylglycine-generating enzyme required for sulfatase activity